NARLVRLLEEAIHLFGDERSERRCRLLARLADELYFDPASMERKVAVSSQAVDLARAIGKPEALGSSLGSYHNAIVEFGRASDRVDVASEMISLAEQHDISVLAFSGLACRAVARLQVGNLDDADTDVERLAMVAGKLHRPRANWFRIGYQAMRRFLEGRFREAEALIEEVMSLGERLGERDTLGQYVGLIFPLRREQKRLAELKPALRSLISATSLVTWRTKLCLLLLDSGREDLARAEFERLAMQPLDDLPKDADWPLAIAEAAELAAAFEDRLRAEQLHALLLPHADLFVTRSTPARTPSGPALAYQGSVSRYLGLLNSVLGRWDDAEHYLAKGIDADARMRAVPFVAHGQIDYASILLRRAGKGDREKAEKLLLAAGDIGRRLQIPRITERIDTLRELRPEPSPAVQPARNEFRREGDTWVLHFAGVSKQLRDSKGLRYIGRLLGDPGEEFHVFRLVDVGLTVLETGALSADGATTLRRGLGDAGELIDERARSEYAHRIADLRSELEQAAKWNDRGREERLSIEIDALSRQLTAAYGFGGRTRRATDMAERVRKAVCNRIRDALTRISREHPALGRHLEAAIRLGTFCRYAPSVEINWLT
ncbi:MAG TPA: hypothetical protein VLF14_05620, partial [Candidatus Binatia bacterium]|nr:hypothetical protein [Candidatus Binatia bacterium]